MARTKGSIGANTLELIKKAGLELIYRHGFAAMSLRQLAALVGIREGSLYNHIPSKQALLFTLVDGHMDDLQAALGDALTGEVGAERQLRDFVAFHLRYHMQRQAEVFVINSELRSLDSDARQIILAKRDRYEKVLVAILDAMIVKDANIRAKAILAMLTGVCTWFKEDGPLSIDHIVTIYTELVFHGTKGRDSAVNVPSRPEDLPSSIHGG